MHDFNYDRLMPFAAQLKRLSAVHSLRRTDAARRERRADLINLSSNDYLGFSEGRSGQELAAKLEDFYRPLGLAQEIFKGATGSPLLTGYSPFTALFEHELAGISGFEAALAFNSGFEANASVISALADEHTLILADRLAHASMIEGLTLARAYHKAEVKRFAHNDLGHLKRLIAAADSQVNRILIVTEALFSMDGDFALLGELCALRREDPRILLYVDEAHSFYTYPRERGFLRAGALGLSCDIDLILVTLGKAFAGTGAVLLCPQVIREYLVNTARGYIFSTALPPLIWAINYYDLMIRSEEAARRQEQLEALVDLARDEFASLGGQVSSQIISLEAGSAQRALMLSEELYKAGFVLLPIRHPTVPKGRERLRLALRADLVPADLRRLAAVLKEKYAS